MYIDQKRASRQKPVNKTDGHLGITSRDPIATNPPPVSVICLF